MIWKETFEGMIPPDVTVPWKRDPWPDPANLWRTVSSASLWGENLPPFPSGSKAAYFGKVNTATGKGSYDFGIVSGALRANAISMIFPRLPDGTTLLSGYPGFVQVSFWILREVEYYPGYSLEYDVTQASINGTVFWKRSSKDKSQRLWQQVFSEPYYVANNQTIDLEFFFHSVDNYSNNFLGWLIDDVEVRVAGLVVDTHVLPPARVGQPYSEIVNVRGGIPKEENGDYYLDVRVVRGNLPPRMVIENNRAILSGTVYVAIISTASPEAPGDYEFELEFEDRLGQKVRKSYRIVVHPAEDVPDTGAQRIFYEDFNAFPLTGWTRTGLWRHTGSEAVYNNEATGNYDTGRRTFGYLTSPEIDISRYGGSDVEVGFDSRRDIEDYESEKYDLTFVEISFDGGAWVRVWEKSSADGPDSDWISETAGPTTIPTAARAMRVRFGFDSIDGLNNNYSGWWVDDVEVRVVTGALKIIGARLPPAEVGVHYRFQFQARGGVPPYTWSADSRLPQGLRLDRYTGELTGVPAAEGEYTFTVKVEDSAGQNTTREFALEVGEKVTLFADGFDNGLGNWIEENLGLWHVTATVPSVNLAGRGGVAYYGQDETGNYVTGARTFGYLTSNPFNTEGAPAFKVEFDYWREVE
ncbi:MAG: Ig domain-containing protein, partial [Candidatus Bipolaricaulaceae bacterium]